MKKVLITGSDGFVGRNLVQALSRRPEYEVLEYDVKHGMDVLTSALAKADVVFHLAGVNRPDKPEEFETGNIGFTKELVSILDKAGRTPLVVLSSSIQALLDNPYGRSKRGAEIVLEDCAGRTGAPVAIFRLPNVFGKWCRPNYNSAVATFCHNIARDLDISVSDPSRDLELVYVDDVVKAFLAMIDSTPRPGAVFHDITPVFKVKLGRVVETIRGFRGSRSDLIVPALNDPFVKRLYATYLSYLPEDRYAYDLEQRTDDRGRLAELLKSPSFGQIFVSRTKRGITRGNHYHDTKTEKFCVLEGEAMIRFRHIQGTEVLSYKVTGGEFRVVDIPPGYTHSIENIGSGELIVLFWASEIFDPGAPDTYPLEVLNEKN